MFEATQHPKRQTTLWVLTAVVMLGFVFAVFLVLAPDRFPVNFVRGEVVKVREDLLLGPYPVEEELRVLKRLGVEEVVSLLDADSPVEGHLVARERKLVETLGMRFVNIPFPVSEVIREPEEKRLAGIAWHIESHPASLRYVHCYLGRHRVMLLREHMNLADISLPH